MWKPCSQRSATLKGNSYGIIATMLIPDLASFVAKFNEVGIKLMRSMGRSSIGKSLDRARNMTSATIRATLKLSSAPGSHTKEDEEHFCQLLGAKHFRPEQVKLLCSRAGYHGFEANDKLLQAAACMRLAWGGDVLGRG